MSNYTLTRADRVTHLKVLGISLVLGILVIGIGISARPSLNAGALNIGDNGGAVKPAKPMNWTAREGATIR